MSSTNSPKFLVRTAEELDNLSDDELRTKINEVAQVSYIWTPLAQVYLNELWHRSQTRVARNVERFTRTIKLLTWIVAGATVVVTLATLANVALALFGLMM